jgi:hypothetical protein
MSSSDKKEILKSLSSLEHYPLNKPFRVAMKGGDKIPGDKKLMELSSTIIVELLRDPTATPLSKFLAVRYAKDLVETFNDDFISLV